MKPPGPRVTSVVPTPGLGQPIIVNGTPGLILDLWEQGEGGWVVRTSRGLVCRIERPLRQMGDSMAWLGRPCAGGDEAPGA